MRPMPPTCWSKASASRRWRAATRRLRAAGAQTVDGGGATLMPGLVEAHAHLSFCHNKELEEFPRIPVEEHVIACIENAKLLLDQGFTSCFSAAAAKPRLDVVLTRGIWDGRGD